jgi:hypothetical protein
MPYHSYGYAVLCQLSSPESNVSSDTRRFEMGSPTNSVCATPGAQHFRIHVDLSGLFSGFAHHHLIEAQITGCANMMVLCLYPDISTA